MKYLLYLAFIVCFAGCAGDSSNFQQKIDSARIADSIAQHSVTGDTVPLKVVAAEDSVSAAKSVAVDSTFRATFRFYYTRSYCGGARPTDEMIKELETPHLLTNSTLILKNHYTGVVFRCKTSPDGEGAVDNITEGKYDVFFTSDINPNLSTGFDAKCSTWQNELLFTVKVNNDDKMRDITVHFVCNPCDTHMKMRP